MILTKVPLFWRRSFALIRSLITCARCFFVSAMDFVTRSGRSFMNLAIFEGLALSKPVGLRAFMPACRTLASLSCASLSSLALLVVLGIVLMSFPPTMDDAEAVISSATTFESAATSLLTAGVLASVGDPWSDGVDGDVLLFFDGDGDPLSA